MSAAQTLSACIALYRLACVDMSFGGRRGKCNTSTPSPHPHPSSKNRKKSGWVVCLFFFLKNYECLFMYRAGYRYGITVPVFLPVFHPRTGILHRYTGVHNVAVICSLSLSLSLSLLISMATVKSLTSTPGLEGSLLRCQGHIGRSETETEGVVSFPLLEAKMPPYVGFAPFHFLPQ